MGRIRTSKWSVLITFSFLYYSWILLLIKVNYVIWRIDAFELWSWRRLLRVPWTREIQPVHSKGNQSWYSLKGLKLETPILWPPDVKNWLIWRPWGWERWKAGEGDNRGWDGWMALPTQWTWVWINSRSWWWTGRPGVLQSMGLQSQETTEWLNWTLFCPLF